MFWEHTCVPSISHCTSRSRFSAAPPISHCHPCALSHLSPLTNPTLPCIVPPVLKREMKGMPKTMGSSVVCILPGFKSMLVEGYFKLGSVTPVMRHPWVLLRTAFITNAVSTVHLSIIHANCDQQQCLFTWPLSHAFSPFPSRKSHPSLPVGTWTD